MSCKVVIVDYGVGNVFSLRKALIYLGANVVVSKRSQELAAADRIILPGVGSFSEGMANSENSGLIDTLWKCFENSRPILGVCLGMQLFFSKSEEGENPGLGFVSDEVRRFDDKSKVVPLIGWNNIFLVDTRSGNSSILSGLPEQVPMYFAHSYYPSVADESLVLATSSYESQGYCAVMRNENLYGCQFHPELSGPQGLQLLSNFLKGVF